jgi:3-hydroxyacyl-[acyl-carrier-protein] dehydratase
MGTAGPLFKIINLETGPDLSCQIRFDIHHDILKGHFPGNPVVPGSWLIRAIHETIENATLSSLRMSSVSQAKFLKPVETSKIDTVNLSAELRKINDRQYSVHAVLFVSEEVFMKFKGTFTARIS